jgi:predicted nucleic-acid-binding protein
MIAVDTNVLVRIVTADHPEQTRKAMALLEAADQVWIAKTVLLELEWVLRYTYGLSAPTIEDAIRKLLGYGKARCEDRSSVIAALAGYAGGLDFADALHLASSRDAARFLTFDRRLAQRSRGLESGTAVELL